MTGMRFCRFAVLSINPGRQGKMFLWNCVCDCGTAKVVAGGLLKSGHAKSCGCLNSELTTQRNFKHGGTRTSEYRTWCLMRQRCNDPRNAKFPRYGARGIRVCQRWEDFSAFLSDMGERPSTSHSIHRIDNDGDYEPDNCQWATPDVQSRNKSTNVRLTVGGVTKIASDWARDIGARPGLITHRLGRGWTPERAVSTPPLR